MNLPTLQLDTEIFKNRASRSLLPSLSRQNPLFSHSQDDANRMRNVPSSQTHLMHKTCFQLTATSKTSTPQERGTGSMKALEQSDPLFDLRPSQFKVISRKKGILIKRKDPLSNRRTNGEYDEQGQKASLNYSTEDSGNFKEINVSYDEKEGYAYSAPITKKKAKKVTFQGNNEISDDISGDFLRKSANHSLFRPKSSEQKIMYGSMVDDKLENQCDAKYFLPSQGANPDRDLLPRPRELDIMLKMEKSQSSNDNISTLGLLNTQTKDALKLQKPLISPMSFKRKEYNLNSNFMGPKGGEEFGLVPQPPNKHTRSITSAQSGLFVDQRALKVPTIFSGNNGYKDSVPNVNITAVITPQARPRIIGTGNSNRKEQIGPYMLGKEGLKGMV